MNESNLQVPNHDLEKIIKEAKTLYAQALRVSEHKAARMQLGGKHMLENTLQKFQHTGENVLSDGRTMASSAAHYVQDNPWRSVTVLTAVASIAILLAMTFKHK